ncbi:DUF2510 domain-containing protein [Microbacterium sp.]|uniref:DUF2510 domain-containing protein n=1 Tax=Microbacterium sp. TaxID=51671 RepID=UPI0028117876|nr:DUF2510 domain-containing protein [Microbacterium sp.]
MSVPAGWYDDGSGRQRWWDGEKWTEHFAPEADAAAQPGQAGDASADVDTDATVRRDDVPQFGDASPSASTPETPAFSAPETPTYSAPEAAAADAPAYAAPEAPAYAAPAYAAPAAYPGADAQQQPYGAPGYPTPGQPGVDPNAPKKQPILGYIGLGLAVVGTILACIPPIISGVGFFLLFAAFVVSIVALFMKFTVKWPAIAGLVLSIVGGILGVVLSVVFFVNLANDAIGELPTDFPSSSAIESDEPADETEGSTDPAGRPSPEEITAGFLIVMHDSGVTDYDDPAVSACIGQEMYDSDLSNETLTTIAAGEDVYEPADEVKHLTEVTTDAILACYQG